jgi:hypothetical protein
MQELRLQQTINGNKICRVRLFIHLHSNNHNLEKCGLGKPTNLDIRPAHLPHSYLQLLLAIQDWALSWQAYAYLQGV